MKKIMITRIGVALILAASILFLAPLAIAEDGLNRDSAVADTAISPAPPLSNFYPIAPCRAVYTPWASRWSYQPFYHNETRAIYLWGWPDASYQGSSQNTGCVPSSAEAVAINVTAIPLSGTGGYMTVWPYGQTLPSTSTINYSAGINQNAIANGVVVGMCPGCTNELNVYNAWGSAHLALDVMGYWLP